MLTDAEAAEMMRRPRCTYPVAPERTCPERSEWVGRCTTCGNDGDGMSQQTVCGEHRFALSGVLDYAADLANITCGVCGKPLRLMWEQL